MSESFPPGGITREFTVWCGQCFNWFQVSEPTVRLAVKRFVHAGWKRVPIIKWRCPECQGLKTKRKSKAKRE